MNKQLVPILKKKRDDTIQYLHTMQTIYDHRQRELVPRAQLYILQSVIEHITVELRWLNTLLTRCNVQVAFQKYVY